jgi:hypothetical protein
VRTAALISKISLSLESLFSIFKASQVPAKTLESNSITTLSAERMLGDNSISDLEKCVCTLNEKKITFSIKD